MIPESDIDISQLIQTFLICSNAGSSRSLVLSLGLRDHSLVSNEDILLSSCIKMTSL